MDKRKRPGLPPGHPYQCRYCGMELHEHEHPTVAETGRPTTLPIRDWLCRGIQPRRKFLMLGIPAVPEYNEDLAHSIASIKSLRMKLGSVRGNYGN